jgi:hypothetical protein
VGDINVFCTLFLFTSGFVPLSFSGKVFNEVVQRQMILYFGIYVKAARESWIAAGLQTVLQSCYQHDNNALACIFYICNTHDSNMVGRVSTLLRCIWNIRNDKIWNNTKNMSRQVRRNVFELCKWSVRCQQFASTIQQYSNRYIITAINEISVGMS